MATSSSTSSVKVVIPAVNSAWKAFAKANAEIDGDTRSALIVLAKVIANQTAPATQITASIEGTGITASAIGYGTVKALPTWLALDAKYGKVKGGASEWKALTIKAQLTLSAKAYSLLGKGKGEEIQGYDTLKVTLENAQAEKTRKAKESKGAKESTGAKVKKTASLTDTLKAISLMIESLDASEIEDSHIEQFNEIQAIFEHKIMQDA